ncbi:DUF4429 domain-containing protein [Streptomyces luteireticuli]|uniref:DUF4429 domain-containing protein n=1 Tax=Streptomyces luteireticuli TaxID=173858 RepID=UPI003556D749
MVGFDGFFLTLVHNNVFHRATCGMGEKRIPVLQLGSVRWKSAGRFGPGFIQFALTGATEKRSLFGRQVWDAAGDENALLFSHRQQPAFREIRKAVEKALAARHVAATAAIRGSGLLEVITGLESLAQLLESGKLSQDEFDVLKSRLLARLYADLALDSNAGA